MRNNKHTLNIAEPCTQNWQQMTPDGAGRFCTHCSKTVVDFTTLSDAQIVEVLKGRSGEMCGRFETGQLNRDLSETKLTVQRSNGFKELLAALLLLLGVRETITAKPPARAAIVQQRYSITKEIKDGTDTVSTSVLKGTVMDSINNESLPFVSIYNVTREIKVTSDFEGHFSINASIGDTVQITYGGYLANMFVVYSYENKTYVLKDSAVKIYTPDYYIDRKSVV